MSITIQPFAQQHVAGAAELERQCFAVPWTEGALREELENPNALFLAAVDTESGETVGYLGYHQILDEGYIANVAVSFRHRRQGIGGRLVRELIERAKAKGASFLTLEVRISNEAAIALYRRYGFRPVGTRPHFYEKPREDALLMTLEFVENNTNERTEVR